MEYQRWFIRLLLLGTLVVMLGAYSGSSRAEAHGKELSIEVSSFTPDAQEPLVRLYRVYIVYAADRDPVTGARVRLTATRRGGGPSMEPVFLEALNEPGVYVGDVSFPLFGSWDVALSVEEAGEGEASFVEAVTPPGPARANEEVRQQVLEIFFRFDWRDVAAIIVRIAHTVGSFIWFGMTGVILMAFVFLPPMSRTPIFRRLSSVFLPAAIFSLLLLLASGVYTATFGSPIKAPGVFDFGTMMKIPFGPQYVATIGFKALALSTCSVLAFRMARALKIAAVPIVAGGSVLVADDMKETLIESVAHRESSLLRLAIANAVIGVLLIGAIVLAIYLHNISHLAAFIPD